MKAMSYLIFLIEQRTCIEVEKHFSIQKVLTKTRQKSKIETIVLFCLE